MRRRGALWLFVLASGCCLGGTAEPSTRAEPSVASPSIAPACLGLCERLASCDRDDGRAPTVADCAEACTPGNVYASLDANMLACAEQPSCDAVRRCAAPGLAAALIGSMAAAGATETPPDWPADFPTVPGGIPRAAPTMGPVRVALIAYPSRDVDTTERAYRDALSAAGWSLTDAPAADGEAHRFVAAREASSVSVSVYRDGSDTIVQTMQLGTMPEHGPS